MTQTWDVTLLLAQPAEGYGNTVSAGYGDATAAQSWPVTLLDGTATGYGETVSSGYGDAAVVGEAVWYTIAVTVLVPDPLATDTEAIFFLGDTVAVFLGQDTTAAFLNSMDTIAEFLGPVPMSARFFYRNVRADFLGDDTEAAFLTMDTEANFIKIED